MQMSKGALHRFAILMTELKLSETDEYNTTVISLINCLILGSEDIWTRHSMRCELIGLGFLDVLDLFRTTTDHELIVQVEVFDHNRMNDDDQLELSDEKSLYDLFTLFLKKVKLFVWNQLSKMLEIINYFDTIWEI